ncbi:hypothetical protein H6F32_16695 [Anabaena sp. FACHB-1237]|uniref:CTB family bacteriocin n=1 Tax=Anabaena sp. FACHB-1237 TaxID=2692769 RepID=UPI0016819254|nr:CTB family bacteriocin [Anabaena sp. FACHB-1237]MBD2139171.1 hypothetical protein [Anabaena sp. FACHB-1237]
MSHQTISSELFTELSTEQQEVIAGGYGWYGHGYGHHGYGGHGYGHHGYGPGYGNGWYGHRHHHWW